MMLHYSVRLFFFVMLMMTSNYTVGQSSCENRLEKIYQKWHKGGLNRSKAYDKIKSSFGKCSDQLVYNYLCKVQGHESKPDFVELESIIVEMKGKNLQIEVPFFFYHMASNRMQEKYRLKSFFANYEFSNPSLITSLNYEEKLEESAVKYFFSLSVDKLISRIRSGESPMDLDDDISETGSRFIATKTMTINQYNSILYPLKSYFFGGDNNLFAITLNRKLSRFIEDENNVIKYNYTFSKSEGSSFNDYELTFNSSNQESANSFLIDLNENCYYVEYHMLHKSVGFQGGMDECIWEDQIQKSTQFGGKKLDANLIASGINSLNYYYIDISSFLKIKFLFSNCKIRESSVQSSSSWSNNKTYDAVSFDVNCDCMNMSKFRDNLLTNFGGEFSDRRSLNRSRICSTSKSWKYVILDSAESQSAFRWMFGDLSFNSGEGIGADVNNSNCGYELKGEIKEQFMLFTDGKKYFVLEAYGNANINEKLFYSPEDDKPYSIREFFGNKRFSTVEEAIEYLTEMVCE